MIDIAIRQENIAGVLSRWFTLSLEHPHNIALNAAIGINGEEYVVIALDRHSVGDGWPYYWLTVLDERFIPDPYTLSSCAQGFRP